jgi:hypothetical protein
VGGAQEFLLDSSQLSPRAGDATSALAGRSRFLSFALPTTKLRNPNGVHQLVAVAFIAADIIALEVKASKMGQELADRMHGVAAPPGVDYFRAGYRCREPARIRDRAPAKWQKAVGRAGTWSGRLWKRARRGSFSLLLHVRYGKTRARPLSARLSSRLASHHRIACAE